MNKEDEDLKLRLPVSYPGHEGVSGEDEELVPYTFDPESDAGKRMIALGLRERLEAETEVWAEWKREQGLSSCPSDTAHWRPLKASNRDDRRIK